MAGSRGVRDCRRALRAHPDGRPRIMGIVNCTPDSFHPASRSIDLELTKQMLAEEVDWIDIGGESTRPGADFVPVDEELNRVIPLIKELRKISDSWISIDTRRPEVAAAALDAGADMVNDVSGLRNPEMMQLVVNRGCAVCIMHMQGEPSNMQNNPTYEDVFDEVYSELLSKARELVKAGHDAEKIVLDPGFGFGKNLQHNLKLLQKIERGDEGFAILWGVSRKSMIGTITGRKDSSERLPGTLAVAMHAQRLGVDILRVHDVAEHTDVAKMLSAIERGV